jgi:hypothetical protein
MQNTNNHQFKHKIKRIWCYFWGHDIDGGGCVQDNKYNPYDYCRFCEGIVGEPTYLFGSQPKSLNVRFLWIRVKLFLIWLINKSTKRSVLR